MKRMTVPVSDLVKAIFSDRLGAEVSVSRQVHNLETGQHQVHVALHFTVPIDVPQAQFDSAEAFVAALKLEIHDAADNMAKCLSAYAEQGKRTCPSAFDFDTNLK